MELKVGDLFVADNTLYRVLCFDTSLNIAGVEDVVTQTTTTIHYTYPISIVPQISREELTKLSKDLTNDPYILQATYARLEQENPELFVFITNMYAHNRDIKTLHTGLTVYLLIEGAYKKIFR